MTKVAILGGSGYTALELVKILLRHRDVEIASVTSRREDKPEITSIHPSLTGRIRLRCEPLNVDRLVAQGVECAFGCLPHGASMSASSGPPGTGHALIDLSADYRLRDPNVYAQWYGESHEDLAHLAQAVYGLPEIYGEEIATANWWPIRDATRRGRYWALPRSLPASTSSFPGSSSTARVGFRGRADCLACALTFRSATKACPRIMSAPIATRPKSNRLWATIAGEAVDVIFTPHLIPMERGIFTTIYAIPRRPFYEEALLELFAEYYARSPFVRVVSHLPATKDCSGTNFLDVTLRLVRDHLVILTCQDNLVRGAAGVAVQNFNRMCGYDEKTALLYT